MQSIRSFFVLFAFLLAAPAFAGPFDSQLLRSRESRDTQVVRDIPLVNWPAPQFFEAPAGVTSSMRGMPMQKVALSLSTYIPVAPCRLVDTRNAFNPVIISPGPFAANEVRVYRAAGNCGLPAGTNRIKGVSVAVTVLPTPASGDIEVISNAATLGGSVLMVVQAQQWNSGTEVTGVDANGDFKVQLRTTSGHLAIDVNGYYAQTDTTNPSDFLSVDGTNGTDGNGLVSVQNHTTVGAAVRGYNTGGADGLLGSGNAALDIAAGAIRVRGAGVGSQTIVFQHKVDTTPGTGNICDTGNNATVLNNQYINGNPAAILVITPTAGVGTAYGTTVPAFGPYVAFYHPTCTGATNRWSIGDTSGNALLNGVTFNVMVVLP